MAPTVSYIVVGEDGGHTALTGNPKLSAGGAQARLAAQGRRGYIARLDGDAHTGTLTMIEPINGPETPFDEVQKRFLERHKSRRHGSNTLFRNYGTGSP
jgi:hypothetical protein